MRRGINNKKTIGKLDKMIIYTGVALLILGIIIVSLFVYSKKISTDMKSSALELENITNSLNKENSIDTESASTDIGKSVEEAEKENKTDNKENDSITDNNSNISKETKVNETNNYNKSIETNASGKKSNVEVQDKSDKEEKKEEELNFTFPVEGEIIKEYAKENLVYSDTLEEWTTHLGIDIKADKTTVVNASEKGVIKSIKNDPRYGLTIVIEHANGYETLYANLLTSEFVVEGENVEKGQAIGTVGNTAVFEIADEPHLHFQIFKDSIEQDPMQFLK